MAAVPPPLTLHWVFNLEKAPSSTEAGRVIGLACAFSSIAFLAVVIRFAIRWRLVRTRAGLDDLSVAASVLLGVVYSGIAIYQTRWGLGLDATDFPPQNVMTFNKVQYAGGPPYCLAILGFKFSLLAFYLRLADRNNTYRIVIQIVMALVVINQLIFTCLLLFACRPIAKTWAPTMNGTCIDQVASYFGLGGSSLGFDLLIIALPFPVLRQLQLPLRQKISIAALFALGLFVTIVQALRMNTIANLKNYTDSIAIIQWSIVEINLGIVIACVPSFAPLLKVFGRKVSLAYLSKSQSQGNKLRGLSTNQRSEGPTRASRSFAPHGSSEDDKVALCESDGQVWVGDAVALSEIGGEDGHGFRASRAKDIHVIHEYSVSSQQA